MKLIADTQRAAMADNGRTSRDADPYPVVKLFTPDANATSLLSEIDPDDPDLAFGLCDLGVGCPELGPVRLRDIAAVRGPWGSRSSATSTFAPPCPLAIMRLRPACPPGS